MVLEHALEVEQELGRLHVGAVEDVVLELAERVAREGHVLQVQRLLPHLREQGLIFVDELREGRPEVVGLGGRRRRVVEGLLVEVAQPPVGGLDPPHGLLEGVDASEELLQVLRLVPTGLQAQLELPAHLPVHGRVGVVEVARRGLVVAVVEDLDLALEAGHLHLLPFLLLQSTLRRLFFWLPVGGQGLVRK